MLQQGLGSEEMSSGVTSPETSQSNVKTCADCGTTKTPLWRGGPAGPKVSTTVLFTTSS